MSDNSPVIKRRRLPSAIWFLPLLAVIIAGWLVYKNYSNKGIEIEVTFDSAAGLEVNKTKVFYRGLPAGVVKKLRIDDDLKGVKVRIEMAQETGASLTDSAQFWLVKPQVSLSGVRGLETLLSGHYIGFQPGNQEDESNRVFTALDQPPPPLKDSDGLYLTLSADSAHSIYPGAKVYFKEIEVGEVLSHSLTYDGAKVQIETYIEPRYTYLIRENTRFWNASGIQVKADLPKIDVQIGSLASIIAGGIHFSEPDNNAGKAKSGQNFHLYKDYDAAENGLKVTLQFPGATELTVGTLIKSHGIDIGRVTKAALSEDYKQLNAELLIDPRASDLLREGSRFWLQQPQLSLTNLGNIGALLRGSHIELEPGQGIQKTQFKALKIAPARRQLANGVAITLNTDSLGSISKGSPILYRQLPVGEVTGYELMPDGEQIQIYGQVERRYQHLINASSRFWNMSGIDFRASLDGINLRTGTATTLLQGGIAFISDPKVRKPAPENGFELFSNHSEALESNGRLAHQEGLFAIRLHTENVGGLPPGTPVLYKKLPVGELIQTSLNKDGQSLTLHVRIQKAYRHLITDASRFWHASGISADVTLKKVRVKTESLKSFIQGGIAFANYGQGQAVRRNHLFTLYPDKEASIQQPLTIDVRFKAGKSIQPLTDVRYKDQIIGQVREVKVTHQGKHLLTEIHLFKDGHFLAKEGSQFWVTEPKFDLTGIEHPTGVITGNFIDVLPGSGKPAFHFEGLDKAPAFRNLPGLNVIIEAPDMGSLLTGSPIFYRKLPVGEVTGFDLTSDGRFVQVYANIQPEYAGLVKDTSVFTNASGVTFDMSLVDGINFRADSLAAIIGGGLNFTSPETGKKAKSGHTFTIDEM